MLILYKVLIQIEWKSLYHADKQDTAAALLFPQKQSHNSGTSIYKPHQKRIVFPVPVVLPVFQNGPHGFFQYLQCFNSPLPPPVSHDRMSHDSNESFSAQDRASFFHSVGSNHPSSHFPDRRKSSAADGTSGASLYLYFSVWTGHWTFFFQLDWLRLN